jgi:ABC-type uncharacterized transport system substrate-binding protein
MDRRNLIGVLSGAIFLRPLAAVGQQRTTPVIGFLGGTSPGTYASNVAALRQGLSEAGYVEGQTVAIKYRWAEGYTERLPGLAEDLISSGVDVQVTAGTLATRAAAAATATTPIIMVGVGNPLAIGVVATLDRPGRNTTGLSSTSRAVIAGRLQLLKELLPNLKRVAIIIRRGDPGFEQTLLDIHGNADRLGLEVFDFAVTTGSSIKLAFTHLQNDRCEAIYLASGPLGPAKRAQIIKNAADAGLPAIYSHGEFTVGGGLMSFGADERDLFHRAAAFVDRILKGAKPADLSVEPPTKFHLAINLNVAKGLGLTVPQSLRARADELIE